MRRRACVMALCVAVSTTVSAQDIRIAPGERLRITAPALGYATREVSVVGLHGDQLIVQRISEGPVAPDTLATGAVIRFEAFDGVGSHVKAGALIGFLSGAALGAVLGAAAYKECIPQERSFPSWDFLAPSNCFLAPSSPGVSAAIGAGVIGLLGAGVGAAIGRSIPKDKWVTFAPRLEAHVTPVRDGRWMIEARVAF